LHATLNRSDAAETAVSICSELLNIGASPLAASASAAAAAAAAAADTSVSVSDGVHVVGETAIDVAVRLRLWDAAALFIMSGKAGAIINNAREDDEAGQPAPTAASPSSASILAKVAAAAADLIDAACAGRTSIVVDLLRQADGDVLVSIISGVDTIIVFITNGPAAVASNHPHPRNPNHDT
jgi:hypothetical protein